MKAIVEAIKPVLIRFLNSEAVRKLVVELLEAYAETTGNKIDDGVVSLVADCLGVEK